MRTIETITNTEPRYFTDRDKALTFANLNPGKLWKRKDDAPSCVKPWAFGELPDSRLEWYGLHSTNGRQA